MVQGSSGLVAPKSGAQGQMPPEGAMPQEGAMPPEEMGEEVPIEADQALQEAVNWIGEKLYGTPLAQELASQMRGGKIQPAILATFAYSLSEKADTATGGNIAAENLSYLAIIALNEVVEVAISSGAQVPPEAISKAMQHMITKYLQDQGVDTSQIERAMEKVDDKEVAALAEAAPEDAL